MNKSLQKIHDLLEVSHNLSTIMDKETLALKQFDLKNIKQTQNQKKELSELYEKKFFDIQKESTDTIKSLSDLDPDLLHHLKRTSVKFQKSCVENKRALHAVLEAHNKVWSTIVESASKEKNKLSNYSDQADTKKSTDQSKVSFVINEQF